MGRFCTVVAHLAIATTAALVMRSMSRLPFWVCFLIAEFVLLANGWLATWEDEQPGVFNNPHPPKSS